MQFVFVPRGMTRERLERRFRDFYKAYFLRPRSLCNYVTMIWRSPYSWLWFWQHAGDFVRFALTNRRFSRAAVPAGTAPNGETHRGD
jgi:hypothetical protein